MTQNTDELPATPRARMQLEQLVRNPDCQANVISAVTDSDIETLFNLTKSDAGFGTSKFASLGGRLFERYIVDSKDNDASPLEQSLRTSELLEPSVKLEIIRFEDRKTKKAHPSAGDFLKQISETKVADTAYLLTQVEMHITGVIPDFISRFLIDLVLLTYDKESGKWTFRVGEAKTYPNRHGLTDEYQLASARAQAGLYVLLVPQMLEKLGVSDSFNISKHVFLVLSSARGRKPALWPAEDVSEQQERAAKAISLFSEYSGLVLAPKSPGQSLEAIDGQAAAFGEHIRTAYSEHCWSFCEMAEHCLRRLIAEDDPLILGTEVKEVLGNRTIEQVQELIASGSAENEADQDLLTRLQDAKFGEND